MPRCGAALARVVVLARRAGRRRARPRAWASGSSTARRRRRAAGARSTRAARCRRWPRPSWPRRRAPAAAQHYRRVASARPLAGRAHRLPRQPADGRRARLLRRHAAALDGGRARCWCSAAGCRATSPSARALPPLATPDGRGRGRGPHRPAAVAAVRVRRRGRGGPIRQNLDLASIRPRDRAAPCCRCRCCSTTRRRRRPTACCATGRRRRSTCTSTTAMPSSGSPSRALIAGLYVWFQLIRPATPLPR